LIYWNKSEKNLQNKIMALTAYTFDNGAHLHNGFSPYWIKTGSDHSTKLNFSLLHYVRVGRLNPSEDVGVFRAKPNNEGDIFFNPQKVLSSYLSGTCIPNTTGWTGTEESAISMQIYFGEEYDDTSPGYIPTGVTQYSFSSATGQHYAVNSYENPESGYQLSGICDYNGTLTYHKLCTDWSSAYYYPIRRSEWMSLSYYQRVTNFSNEWNILTYGLSGNQLGHFIIPIPDTTVTWKSSYQLASGTNNLSYSGYNYFTSANNQLDFEEFNSSKQLDQ
jgi:hypothetical protein